MSATPGDVPAVPRWRQVAGRVLPWIVATLGSLVVAYSFGFVFPEGNQNTYLVHGLVLHDPTLLPRDWYAREATDYHHAFSLLVYFLFGISDGPMPFVLLDVLLVVASGCAVLALARAIWPPASGKGTAWLAFATWLGFGTLTHTTDVMGSYVFGGYLQPSSIGTAGYLWALALFARRRFAWSGVALAAGGLFHLNFLVLGIATIGLSHVAAHRGRVWKRPFWFDVLRNMAAPTVVFLWALPLLLEAARGPVAAALPILFDIRAPHHFKPTFDELKPFLALQLAAWIVVVSQWVRKPANEPAKETAPPPPLVQLLAGVGGFCLLATIFTIGVRVPQVQQMFPFRIAPMATLVAMFVVVGTAGRAALVGTGKLRWLALLIAGGVFAYGIDTVVFGVEEAQTLLAAVAVVLIVGALVCRFWKPRAAAIIVAVGVSLAVVGSVADMIEFEEPHVVGVAKAKRRLAKWARKNTPIDAVFVVPPDFIDFRLVVRRSIVVDWKSAGMLPKDIVTWGELMKDVTGARSVPRRGGSINGYATMDRARAQRLHDEHGATYAVVDKRRTKRVKGASLGTPVYDDGRYAVYTLPPPAPVPAALVPLVAPAPSPPPGDR